MILFLHNRYRTTGGEERVVDDLRWLVQEQFGEETLLLSRDSAGLSGVRAASGLLRGGLQPEEVGDAVRHSGARVVHAHNLLPTFGWRALRAAREAGARVVLHLHQYRLVCANGVCFTQGAPCTRCHGVNTLPGVARNCRGSRAEGVSYGAALALWQRRTIAQADAIVVPSVFARERLRELGAPLPWARVHVVAPPLRAFAERSTAATGSYALVVSRLAREKGVEVAIEACSRAGVPLRIAGDGPELDALRRRAQSSEVRFEGRVDGERLATLRRGAALALAPSRSDETFGLAAAESLAAGVPVAGSDVGALRELLGAESLAPAGDASALAEQVRALWGDARAGERGLARVRALCAPAAVAGRLAAIYDKPISGMSS